MINSNQLFRILIASLDSSVRWIQKWSKSLCYVCDRERQTVANPLNIEQIFNISKHKYTYFTVNVFSSISNVYKINCEKAFN